MRFPLRPFPLPFSACHFLCSPSLSPLSPQSPLVFLICSYRRGANAGCYWKLKRVRTFPKESALLGRDTVRALMYYALKVWSDIAPLNFHEVAGNEAGHPDRLHQSGPQRRLPFRRAWRYRGSRVLSWRALHRRDTHFDDDEAWTFRSPGKSVEAGLRLSSS
uniref:Peptidase M10 metallopeptidase domain-containing protein n=1 Tax=Astyanax mexicanus TaxID=7994 RepID=A0A3B1JF49_ASTMX